MRTDDRSEGEQLVSKKAYAPPKLTEYGSVAKLTEGGGGSGTDFVGKAPKGGPTNGGPRR
jgi:hypothetical protein